MFKTTYTAAFTFWLLEAAFFGFNLRAQSMSEEVCDYVFIAMLVAAFLTKLSETMREAIK